MISLVYISTLLLYNAHKAFSHRILTELSRWVRGQWTQQLDDLVNNIKGLEQQNKKSTTAQQTQLQSAKRHQEFYFWKSVTFPLKYPKLSYYSSSNRAGELLAHKLYHIT